MTLPIDRLTRPDASCVHFTDEAPADTDLEAPGIEVARIDGGGISDDSELLAEVAGALRFPDYFGHNWDALNDCLRDLGWLPAEGYVLVVSGADALWRRDPRIAGGLIESWLFCAEAWIGKGTPFHLVFEW